MWAALKNGPVILPIKNHRTPASIIWIKHTKIMKNTELIFIDSSACFIDEISAIKIKKAINARLIDNRTPINAHEEFLDRSIWNLFIFHAAFQINRISPSFA